MPFIQDGENPTIIAGNDRYETVEDTPLSVDAANGVLANDSTTLAGELEAVLVANVAHGELNLEASGAFQYAPDSNFHGEDQFTYLAGVGTTLSSPVLVNLTVNEANDAPVARDDHYETDEDVLLSVNAAEGVLANDSDADMDSIQATLISGASNGNLSLNDDGSFGYQPNPGFNGQDSFTYVATDQRVPSTVGQVTMTINAVNHAPVATIDGYKVSEDIELAASTDAGLLANDTDIEESTLHAILVTDVSHGELVLHDDGSFDYSPAAEFSGEDSFTYKASDGVHSSNTATVTIEVCAVNDPPVAVDDAYETTEDIPLAVDAENGVLANDSDIDTGINTATLQAVLENDVTNGALSLNLDGSFLYTPNPGFNGQDSFTYRADDGEDVSLPASVRITVTAAVINRAPKIVTGEIEFEKSIIGTDMDETHMVVVADYDADGDNDAAATDYIDGMVFWFRNEGEGEFTPFVIDPNLVGAYPAHTDDVDQDGDPDILSAGYDSDTYAWYRNDGSGNFTRVDIDLAADGAHSIVTVDLDEDTDLDLVTADQDAGAVAWYENTGSNAYTRHDIDIDARMSKRAEVADFNGDGHLDIVAGNYGYDEVAWYENDGDENFTKHVVYSDADGVYYVYPADIDGDDDVDIFAISRLDNSVHWFENEGASSWTHHLMDTNTLHGRTIIGVDVDDDGDMDGLTASVQDNTVAWFINDGDGNFTKRVIDDDARGAYGLFAIDFDFDGDIEVLSASKWDKKIALNTQYRAHSERTNAGGTLTLTTAMLQTVDEDDGPSELTYTLVEPPTKGDLQLNGSPLVEGGAFTQADVNQGRVGYVRSAGGTAADSFGFNVADGGEDGIEPAGGTFEIRVGG